MTTQFLIPKPDGFPRVVCLCGSTRFADAMNRIAEKQTRAGEIVVRPEVVSYSRENDPQYVAPAVKEELDELHKRKIDLAHYVLVVCPDWYIGESTESEIQYAKETRKPIRYIPYVDDYVNGNSLGFWKRLDEDEDFGEIDCG